MFLHPKWYLNDLATEAAVDALEFDYPTVPLGFYCVYDINEMSNDEENEDKFFPIIGLGDFLYFDLLLLFVMPVNSSITTRAYIAFGCIIFVQLGDLCTVLILHYSDSGHWPALPVPTITVTAYAIAVDAIIQNSHCGYEELLT